MYDEPDEEVAIYIGPNTDELPAQYLARMLAKRNELAMTTSAVQLHQEMVDYEHALEFHFAESAYLNLIEEWKGTPEQLASKCWRFGRAMVQEGYRNSETKEEQEPVLPEVGTTDDDKLL